ncbi:unnamed protein product [Closterium sp. NIES-54]
MPLSISLSQRQNNRNDFHPLSDHDHLPLTKEQLNLFLSLIRNTSDVNGANHVSFSRHVSSTVSTISRFRSPVACIQLVVVVATVALLLLFAFGGYQLPFRDSLLLAKYPSNGEIGVAGESPLLAAYHSSGQLKQGVGSVQGEQRGQRGQQGQQGQALIPGSSVTSQAAVSAFRTRHACLANHGAWRLDPVPRLLPWTAPSSSGWGGWQCDVAWTVNASAMSASDGGGKATVDVSTSGGGHVAWGAADKVVLQGLPAGDWRVRQAVKYRWLPHRTCGRWEDVGNSKIAELLNGKRMLIVGDSISGMLFFSLRNHLMQNFSVPEAAQEAAAAADTEGSEKLPVWDVVPDFCKASWQHGLRW